MDEIELIAGCEECGKEFKDEMGLKVFYFKKNLIHIAVWQTQNIYLLFLYS